MKLNPEQEIPQASVLTAERSAPERHSSTNTEQDATARKIVKLRLAVERRRAQRSRFKLSAALLLACVTGLSVLLERPAGGVVPLCVLLGCGAAASYAAMLWGLVGGIVRLRRGIEPLADLEDVGGLPAMVEALSVGEPAYSIASSVLIRLLPELNGTQADELLTPDVRQGLRTALQHSCTRWRISGYNPALSIAILQAMARYGDAEDRKLAARLAGMRGEGEDARAVREAAAACANALLLAQNPAAAPELLATSAGRDSTSGHLPSERLSERLRQISRLRKRNVNITAAGAVGATALAGISLARLAAGLPDMPAVSAGIWTCVGILCCFSGFGVYAQRNLTYALSNTDDTGLIPPLLQAASSVEISGATAAIVLTRLLPKLRASDANLLGAEERVFLNTALDRHFRNGAFVLAALSALKQVGDSSAIPAVERIVRRANRMAEGDEVRRSALECLEFLNLRAEQANANRTLLRASSGAEAGSNDLVRAAGPAADTVQDELLRSSNIQSCVSEVPLCALYSRRNLSSPPSRIGKGAGGLG